MKYSHTFVKSAFSLVFAGFISIFPLSVAQAAPVLNLVSSRDNIEGSFTAPRTVWADSTHIYLASYQGTIFVLERNRERNFPVVATIEVPSSLTAVRGDGNRIYVSSIDGNVRVYNKSSRALVATVPVVSYGVSSIEVIGNSLYVGTGQTSFAVDSQYVYLASLSEGDAVYQVEKGTYRTIKTYGDTFEPDVTVVYNRTTGARIRSIPNPHNLFGQSSYPNLYAHSGIVYATAPGCCGAEVTLTNAKGVQKVLPTMYANTAHVKGTMTAVGTESGAVDLYDRNKFVSRVHLRETTGHTGGEDIEIRALWRDKHDNLIFAGSSWGNDESRSASLPSFFVLEVTQ